MPVIEQDRAETPAITWLKSSGSFGNTNGELDRLDAFHFGERLILAIRIELGDEGLGDFRKWDDNSLPWQLDFVNGYFGTGPEGRYGKGDGAGLRFARLTGSNVTGFYGYGYWFVHGWFLFWLVVYMANT